MLGWELHLREIILADLENGRPGFDGPHTEGVVHWVKRIVGHEEGLDFKVLVTAAYAHDWGYVGLFGDETSYDEIQDKKANHMVVGAQKIRELLQDELSEFYSPEEIDLIAHLVRVHDKLDELESEHELALMEADTLGALDTDFVSPTFSKEDNDKYMQEVQRRRRPLFVHESAIGVFDELLEKRVDFYDSEKS